MSDRHLPIDPFLSGAVRKHAGLAEAACRDGLLCAPGGLLFADISGFSRLARSFADRGGEGAEQLTGLINGYFEQLIQILQHHGCDIVAFAGDAVFATVHGSDLAESAHRAAAAALAVTESLSEQRVAGGITLSIRVSVGAGELGTVSLGSDSEQQLMLMGAPLRQVRQADKLAQPGQTLLSPEVVGLLGDSVVVEPIMPQGYRMLGLRTAPEYHGCSPLVSSADSMLELRRFVPPAVLSRIDVGQTEWLAELRRTAIAFVRFDDVNADSLDNAVRLRQLADRSQRVARRYDGSVIHFLADDKGTVAILGFGIPPGSPEGLAERAVAAAGCLRQELELQQTQVSIGIATGDVFCGPLGGRQRKCFTVLGDVVNLAARLMQSSHGELLCDTQTRDECRRAAFVRIPNHVIKGYDAPVPAFRIRASEVSRRLVGREEELHLIDAFLARDATGVPRILLIEGEPGIGKSALIEYLLELSQARNQVAILGEASSLERLTPFFIMRNVIARLFGLSSDSASMERRKRSVLRLIDGLPAELRPLTPLLNSILDTDFEEDDFLRQLDGERRMDNLHRLVTAILRQAAAAGELRTIVLDDVQWLDEASWKLIRILIDQLKDVAFLFVSRPLVDQIPLVMQEILQLASATHHALRPLDRPATVQLLQQILGGFQLDSLLVEYAWSRSGGNPFFVKELMSFLTAADELIVVDGVCKLQTQPEGLSAIPNSIRDILAGRIGQLPQEVQMTAKAASVIGRSFQFRELDAIYPVAELKAELPRYVNHLCGHDIVAVLRKLNRKTSRELKVNSLTSPADSLGPPEQDDIAYTFSHLTTQQVAYQQLPLGQRKQLHQQIAHWYRDHVDERNQAVIAYHLEKAERHGEASAAFARAGEFALKQGANREAIGFLTKALDYRTAAIVGSAAREVAGSLEVTEKDSVEVNGTPITGLAAITTERVSEAGWQAHYRRLLGEAYVQVGDIQAGRRELELALELLDRRPPTGRTANLSRVALFMLGQVIKRWTGRRLTVGKLTDEPRPGDTAHCMALAHQRLAQIHYFENDLILGTARALQGLSIAESMDDSPGLARSYAAMCIVHCMLRHRRAADYYASLGERVARRVGHLPTLAYVLNLANIHRLADCRLTEVEDLGRESVEISTRLQSHRDLAESLTVVAMSHCFRGQLTQGLEVFEQVGAVAAAGRNSLHAAWAACGQGECLLRQGQYVAANKQLRQALKLLQGGPNATEQLRARGLLGLGLWRTGHTEEALEAAQDIVRTTFNSPTVSAMEGISATVEVLLEAYRCSSDDNQLLRALAVMLHRFEQFARTFPIARARYQCWLGALKAAQGKMAIAQRCWRVGLAAARRADLSCEEGMLWLEIAQASRRKEDVECAEAILAETELAPQRNAAGLIID